MNKTISIHLGGQVFQVDENAFEKLGKYLQSIRAKFEGTEGRDEIIADIESRIAEMFRERLSEKKQVISIEDVNAAIHIMGKPEDFERDTDPTTEEFKTTQKIRNS